MKSIKLDTGAKTRGFSQTNVELVKTLPSDLICDILDASNSTLKELPKGIQVSQRIILSDCKQLVSLPKGLKTGTLLLRNCTKLEALPEGLDVHFLDISGCTKIRSLPQKGAIRLGRLVARDCENLERLPDWLDGLSGLDLQNCSKLEQLPSTLKLSAWLDPAGTGIKSLPSQLNGVGLRWRGVPVDNRIVFHPESLTSDDILTQRNAEVRRVMLERVGFERFVELAKAEVLNSDHDKGGERKLLKVVMPEDEDLICVSFSCPSTGRRYVVRVPPNTATCHAAVAWIAGFDNPDDYKPDMES